MEAALRTVSELLTGEELKKVDFEAVRGMQGIKEATIKVGDTDVHVAVANGTGNASKLLDMIRSGEKTYHFIEMMGCPGGCVTGGGQPIVPSPERDLINPALLRAKGLYDEDKSKTLRKSHLNPEIQTLYKDFLGSPNSHKSHELLHTHYQARKPHC